MEDYGLPSLQLSPSDLLESASIVPIDSQHQAELFKSLAFIQTSLNNQHVISFITHFPKGGEKNYNMPI